MGLSDRDLWVARIDVRQYCRDGAVNEIRAKAIEVFASRVGIPVKTGYCIAVVSYALMKCCPVSARMCNTGGPFFLEELRVLRHVLFIDEDASLLGNFWNKKGAMNEPAPFFNLMMVIFNSI